MAFSEQLRPVSPARNPDELNNASAMRGTVCPANATTCPRGTGGVPVEPQADENRPPPPNVASIPP
jgi:hypothetical protein